MPHLPFAPFGSSRRRAMWRELEVMWTGQPEARARRTAMEVEHDLGIPYDELPAVYDELGALSDDSIST